MKKLKAERNFKKDRLSGLFLTVLILVVICLSVGRVVIANRLVETGEKLRALDQNIEAVKDGNQNLAESLRQPQSLSQIEGRAKAIGFVKTSRLVFLGKETPVAFLP